MHGVSVLVVLAVLTCAACSGSDPEQTGGVPPPPEVGQCHNTPESYLNTAPYDDSPVVECSQPHTLQTLKVIDTDEEITPELLEQLATYCHAEAVAKYIDSPGAGAYNLVYPIVFGPTPEQQEAGQSWVRCEAGHQAATRLVGCCKPLATTTESLEGAMGTDIASFQQCVAEVPDPDRRQPLVSCKEPHRGELLLTLMELEASAYPSAAKLERAGQSQCRELAADRDDADALRLTPDWQAEEFWTGDTIYGFCWIHRKTGLLPAA